MKKQIILAFAVIFSLFGLGAGVIVYNMMNSASSLRNLIDLHEIEDIRQNLNLRVQKLQTYVNLSAIDFSYNIDEIVDNVQQMEEAAQECFGCHHKPVVQEELIYTEKLIRDFQEKLSFLITSRSDVSWRRQNQQQAMKIADTINMHVQDMVTDAAVTLQQKTDAAIEGIERTYSLLLGTFLVTLLLAVGIAHFLTKRLVVPIDELLVAASKIADGDLGHKIDLHGVDEFVRLQESFNRMSASLVEKEVENVELCKNLKGRIRELHRTQHQLVQAGKLASLGKLAGGISHDFNNLLCGIIGQISILKRAEIDPEKRQSLADIEKAAMRASQLVAQLQTFANQRDWQEVAVNINSIVIAAVQSVQHEMRKEVMIHMDLSQGLPTVVGDPDRLQVMVRNICENAVQVVYEKDDGLVEVGVDSMLVTADSEISLPLVPGTYIKIYVRDNGKGIPVDIVSNIFDPYFTTQKKTERNGIGLGMAISYVIATKHEGHIEIASTENVGTTVAVFLPVSGASMGSDYNESFMKNIKYRQV